MKRCEGAIIGEGGVGKTTFAVELLRSANNKGLAGRELIGVFLPAESIPDPEKFESVLSAIQQVLSDAIRGHRKLRAGDGVETEDLEFIKLLLSGGYIVLVVDDLSRYVDEKWALAAHAEFREWFAQIFYTGRMRVASLSRLIEPQPIDKMRLLTFVDTYLAGAGLGQLTARNGPTSTMAWTPCTSARNLVPALFAKLVAEEVRRQRASGGTMIELALSMPELVLSLVRQTFETVPKEYLVGLDSAEYWRCVGRLAWGCLAAGLRVAPISQRRGAGNAQGVRG